MNTENRIDVLQGMFPEDSAVVWRYNDVELEVDMFDVEFSEKLRTAFGKMDASVAKESSGGDTLKEMADTALLFRNCLTEIFGEETMFQLLGEKLNARKAVRCCTSLFEFITKQTAGMKQSASALNGPTATNREQRRAADRKGPKNQVN